LYCREHNLEVLDADPNYIAKDLPDSFDARTNWANCTVISKIRDQSACGSCWAFGSTESFEDRRCIATGEDIEFSTADTGGCSGFGDGCGGGDPTSALQWMVSKGVVTGGDFDDKSKGTGCSPYNFQPCAHHVPASAKYPTCPTKEYKLTCAKSCTDSTYKKAYAADKTKVEMMPFPLFPLH
jgi:cathepsin B